jgi:hypothetical protein
VEGGLVGTSTWLKGGGQGGLVNDRCPGAMAMGGMAMTQRWQVRLRAWEHWNPKREGTDG